MRTMLFYFVLFMAVSTSTAQTGYTIKPVQGINTDKDDIACGLMNDQLIVITTGEKDLVNDYSWNARQVFHLNLFTRGADFSQWNNKTRLFTHKVFMDEGPATFDFRDSTLYFSTAENYGRATGNRLKIYASKKTNNGWSSPELLPFCLPNADYAHPAFDPERNLLVFSSSQSGGLGMMDIWYVYKTESGWGQAVNAGERVNSAANEIFPTVFDGNIYFSSNSPGGMGGFDLMKASGKHQWKIATRMSEPFNSAKDDIMIAFLNDDKMLVTSNRNGGKGGDDIYLIIKNPEEYELQNFEARLLCKGMPIENIQVKASNTDNEEVFNHTTDHLGKFPVQTLLLNKQYKVQLAGIDPALYTDCVLQILDHEKKIIKEIRFNSFGFLILELLPFNYQSLNLLAAEDGSLLPSEEAKSLLQVNVEGQLYKDSPGDIGRGEPITILDESGVPAAIAFTNETGKFRFTELKPQRDYQFKLADNAKAKSILITESGKQITLPVLEAEAHYQRIQPNEAIELVNEYNETIFVSPKDIFVINRIYYDYNSARLTPASKMQLDQLEILVQKNNKLRIEMRSHTDSRGSTEYNKQLSERRAEAVIQYMMDKGLKRKRFEAIGFGEEQLLNECSDGVPCLEPEHRINRRTEIRLVEDQ